MFSSLQRIIKSLISHPLISGSTVVFIGGFIANIFAYFVNLMMLRLLSVSDYGLLTSLNSLLVLFGIFQTSFTNLFVRYTAEFEGKSDAEGSKRLMEVGVKVVIAFSVILLVIQILLIDPLAHFIHVSQKELLVLMFLTIFISINSSLPYGIIQGKMKFILNSFLIIISQVLRFILGILLIYVGYRVFGAIGATFISSLVVFIGLSIYLYRIHYSSHKLSSILDEKKFIKEFIKSTYAFFLSAIGMTLLSNADILLVRHLMGEEASGQYAAISLMGKAIFYLTAPINFVFFPLIAYKHGRKEHLFQTLALALAVVTLGTTAISFVYFVFPNVILAIFAPGERYEILAPYLGIFSLYILIFSLASLFNNFFLSIGKTGVYKITLVASILQIVLLFLFHESFYQIIGILFGVSFLLFTAFVVYYLIHGRD